MVLAEDVFRVAVVGLGKMGILHSCILSVLPNVKLVALCDKTSLTRKVMKGIFKDTEIVEDVNELARSNPDAVYVTTPIPSHFAVTKAVCSAKIATNLFVEKTLGANFKESDEMRRLTTGLGGTNMVGYLRRFYVTFRKAKELIDQASIGTIHSFKAYSFSSDFLGMKSGATAPESRGGVMRDLGCHALDLALWYFGEMQVQTAEIKSLISPASEDSVHFSTENTSGVKGEFDVSWIAENYRMPEVGLSIVGSEGILKVNDDLVSLTRKNAEPKIWHRHDLADNVPFWLALPEYYREDFSFITAARERKPVEPSIQSASEVDRVIEEIKGRAEKNGKNI
jgi:predicted dehydrogenase